MSITSPIEVGLQHNAKARRAIESQDDDLQIIEDELIIIPDGLSAETISATEANSRGREPLVPFLILGIASLLAILAAAILLAL